MKTLLLIAIAMTGIIERPPIPTDIPFEYDPNMLTADIMRWYVAEPNLTFVCSPSAKNRWGLHVDLTAIDFYDANTPILIDRGVKEKDIDDGGWIQHFNVMVTPSTEGVHYIELTATDKRGRFDKRTLLVLCVADDPPFLFMETAPTISEAEAQRTWQVAKKVGYPATSPTSLK